MSAKRDVPSVSREFISALGDVNSYLPWRNVHALFGLIWGLPIPLFATAIDVMVRALPLTLANVLDSFWLHPMHLVFLLHPPIFMVLFGAMGTVRRGKDERIESLMGELHRNLDEIRRAHDALKELDRLKDEFMANLTHELKTPLVAACGYSEMMLQGRLGQVSEKQRHGLEVSIRNLRQLEQLINDILDLTRLESGEAGFMPEVLDMGELLAEVTASVQLAMQDKELTLKMPDPLPRAEVKADRNGIRTVLTNLFSNAVKFTERGGEISVQVQLDVPGAVTVEVADTGVGIPERVLPYVFDRFRQAEGSTKRRHAGIGLGLAIVKKILDAHGVTIHVESRVGHGSKFRFSLPAVQDLAQARVAHAPASRG